MGIIRILEGGAKVVNREPPIPFSYIAWEARKYWMSHNIINYQLTLTRFSKNSGAVTPPDSNLSFVSEPMARTEVQ